MRHENLSRFDSCLSEREFLWRDIDADAIKTLEESMRVSVHIYLFIY